MRFKMRSSPACNDRCRCGIRRGSLASASNRSASASTESMDDSRRRASSGTSRRMRLTSAPSRRSPSAVAGDVDAGEHHLAIAAFDEPAHLRHHVVHRQRTRIAAAERNDAEGAAVVAAVLHLHEGAGAAVDAVDRMRAHVAHRHDVGDGDLLVRAATRVASSFSSLPMTRSTSGMPAKSSGLVCAAQPVTTMRASGRSRLSRRMVCRAWRTASAVTAQVFTTTASSTPAAPASRLITSDS